MKICRRETVHLSMKSPDYCCQYLFVEPVTKINAVKESVIMHTERLYEAWLTAASSVTWPVVELIANTPP